MQKNKIVLIALVVAVVALIPGRYVMGIRSGILDDKKEIDALNDEYEARLATAQDANTDLDANREIVQVISAGLPPSFNFDSILIELSDLASSSGITLSSANPVQAIGIEEGGGVAGPGGTVPYSVSITITGSVNNVKAFLSGLRGLPRIVLLDTVALAITEDGEVTTTLPLTVFTWTPPAVVTPTG